MASGNVLANDTGLAVDPASITFGIGLEEPPTVLLRSTASSRSTGPTATLSLVTAGANAGNYTYTLDSGVVPPSSNASDALFYTLTDQYGNATSATLTIDISSGQVVVAQAVDDTNSIDVTDSTLPPFVFSSTVASGNVLANDTGLAVDPASITSVSDSKSPTVLLRSTASSRSTGRTARSRS